VTDIHIYIYIYIHTTLAAISGHTLRSNAERLIMHACLKCLAMCVPNFNYDHNKDFDSVPHRPLLQNLKNWVHNVHSVHPHILRWITHYLCKRSQYVCGNGSSSGVLPVIKKLGLLCRALSLSNNSSTKRLLYISLVRSQLVYCSPVWRPHHMKDIKLFENVQRRATKFIVNDFSMNYKSRLLQLKFPSPCCMSSMTFASLWSPWRIPILASIS